MLRNIVLTMAGPLLVGGACAVDTAQPDATNPTMHRTEWRASTFAVSSQAQAACTINAAGELVVTWSSRRQQDGQYGVYLQTFDPNGVAVGNETQVNLWTESHQMSPSIAAGASPSAPTWVAWQSHHQDGDAGTIVARAFDPNGIGGSEVAVNAEWCGHQSNPIVSARADGSALCAWTHQHGDTTELHVQSIGADGTPVGRSIVLNVPAGQKPTVSSMATDPASGAGAIVYGIADADTHQPLGLRMQRVDATGAPVGPAIDVSNNTSSIEPVIAADRNGGWIVAWLDSTADGDSYGVMMRRISDHNNAAHAPVLVNQGRTVGSQHAAAIAVAHDGSSTVAFNSPDEDGMGVFAQSFDASGARAGDIFRVNKHVEGDQAMDVARGTSRLTYGHDGTLYCAWNGDAGFEDSSSVNVTMVSTSAPPAPAMARGVRPDMPAALLGDDASARAHATAKPHRPPTFDPSAIEPAERQIFAGPSGVGFTGVTNTGWTPPDPQLAVGPNHVVAVTNGAIAIYDKGGNNLFQDEIEDSFGFWGDQGATGFVFDPEALYDTIHNRYWVMAAEAFAPGNRSYVLIAVSDDDNPLGNWNKYRLETTSLAGDLFDSPNIGVDEDVVYVTGDGFGSGVNYPIFTYDKAAMLAGQPVSAAQSTTLSTSTQSAGIPPIMETSDGAFYMVEHQEGSSNSQVRVIAMTNPLTGPSFQSFMLTVPAYGRPGNPDQAGTSSTVNTFDGRFWSTCYRNGSLWATHHADQQRVRVRWYQIEMNGWPFSGNTPTLAQSGQIDPGPGIYTFFSAITADDAGNAMVTYSRSSANEFFSMRTAFRYASDPLGTMQPGIERTVATGPYTAGRWGDYAAVELDPADGKTFWAIHEGATGNSWNTWIQSETPFYSDGDVNCDGVVNVTDLLDLLAAWGSCDGCPEDVNGDGSVNVDDLLLLLANWS